MKTILVPIDYSDVADNALNYAIDLANHIKAKVILFHAYQVPVPTGDAPVMLISPEDIKKENMSKMEKHLKKVSSRMQEPAMIESEVRSGFAVEEILALAKEKQADLIVMGVTGAGIVSETLLGSNATSVISNTIVPVLVVPSKAKFKKPDKVVLAYDYEAGLRSHQTENIKKFVEMFNAKILVLDVVKPTNEPSYSNAMAGLKIENALSEIEHTVYFPEGEDIPEAINKFSDTYHADWLIMMPRKHSFLSKLFQKSNTKKMAFHSHIPLLSLHE